MSTLRTLNINTLGSSMQVLLENNRWTDCGVVLETKEEAIALKNDPHLFERPEYQECRSINIFYRMQVRYQLMEFPEVLPSAVVEPVESEVTVESVWDGSFVYRVPTDAGREIEAWSQYTIDGHTLVDIVSGTASISQGEAALWLSASYTYYVTTSPIEDESMLDAGTFVAILSQAMVEGRLEVAAGNLMDQRGKEIDFYYKE